MGRLAPTLASTRVGWAIALVCAGCQVDAGNGFGGVMTGGASAASTAGMTGDATEGNHDDDDDDTAGETEAADSTGADGPTGGTGQTGDTGMATSAGSTSSMGLTDGTDGSDSDGAGACMGMPLDAALQVPPLCAPTCDAIGFGIDCPAIEICRLKDSQTAVCESCEPCGNLHDPCTASSQCDILFTCYLGQCTAMYDFATPQTCGNPAACTNVGHPTHGVCDPNL